MDKPLTEYNEYWILDGIKQRCLNTNNPQYHNYGGRGIKICDRWKESFINFYEDMGGRPSKKHSVDRIDNNGDYRPENCRWATQKEQCNNKRTSRKLKYNEKTLTASEWGFDLGIKPNTILYRIRRGWSIGQALGFEDRITIRKPYSKVWDIYNGRMTKEQISELRKYVLNNGATDKSMGAYFNIHSTQISRIRKKYNIYKGDVIDFYNIECIVLSIIINDFDYFKSLVKTHNPKMKGFKNYEEIMRRIKEMDEDYYRKLFIKHNS